VYCTAAVVEGTSDVACVILCMQNLGLAVRAFRLMLDGDEALAAQCALVIAGGYDKRLAENREHYCEIQELVKQLGVETHVCAKPTALETCSLIL
jgi:alpha-1,3/alpha-1,6-mannosyltransferase